MLWPPSDRRSTVDSTADAQLHEEEAGLLASLRAGDEKVFLSLVRRHQTSMIRVALLYVPTKAVAEEVVQEAWVGVLQGLEKFEGRSSLKSWIFRILTNCAMSRGGREARSKPFSALAEEPGEPLVDPSRFRGPESPHWEGHWAAPPQRWTDDQLAAHQTAQIARRAIEELPRGQRDVITLRDVEGWSSDETCEALGLTEANQRVLLHRARAKVRAVLEQQLKAEKR
ncbi:MAG: RNA polymerase sigma factor [Deltaproteobacteria bacterium]|nr:RNA polymerase sigma factor [Deltaproteobacteria bacterium]